MKNKQIEFDEMYERKSSNIKWFEPYIQPKMLDEWNEKQLLSGMKLLDVGGGCSLDSIFYASNGIDTTVVDFSSNALEKLKLMADFYGVKIDCMNHSILSMPEQYNRAFDVVTDNGCFHHIEPEDRANYAKAVANLLKKDGLLYIRAMSEYVPPSTDSQLRAYRISSDDILNSNFLDNFKLVEMSLFDYTLNPRGRQKIWFIKMKRRS